MSITPYYLANKGKDWLFDKILDNLLEKNEISEKNISQNYLKSIKITFESLFDKNLESQKIKELFTSYTTKYPSIQRLTQDYNSYSVSAGCSIVEKDNEFSLYIFNNILVKESRLKEIVYASDMDKLKVFLSLFRKNFYELLPDSLVISGNACKLDETVHLLKSHRLILEKAEQFINDYNNQKKVNSVFYDGFTNKMFLHRNSEKQVNLENLFVIQEGEQKNDILELSEQSFLKSDQVLKKLVEFINNDWKINGENLLFIEGDAGVGKSSLVSFLAYYCVEKELFVNRYNQFLREDAKVLCVRLRDTEPELGNCTSQDVINYINNELSRLGQNLNNNMLENANITLILDGFDELCLVENVLSEKTTFLKRIIDGFSEYKLIITSRRHYIRYENLRLRANRYNVINLKHFSKIKRNEWLDKYLDLFPNFTNYKVLNFIRSISEDDSDGVCDTGMALYLICAGDISEEALTNQWLLYNEIFSQKITRKKYNKIFQNQRLLDDSDLALYSSELYKLNEEIAYKMFLDNNTNLSVTSEEIKLIVQKLNFPNQEISLIVQECYTLCNYWKKNKKRGAVEFYHNNIRDFFMCEKIYRILSDAFDENSIYNVEKGEIADYFITVFQNLFQGILPAKKVVELLKERITYEISRNDQDSLYMKGKKKEHKESCYESILETIFQKYSITHINSESKLSICEQMKNNLKVIITIFSIILNLDDVEEEKINFFDNCNEECNQIVSSEDPFAFLSPQDYYSITKLIEADNKTFSKLQREDSISELNYYMTNNFSNYNFRRITFKKIVFYKFYFSHCLFENVSFDECIFIDCEFLDSSMKKINFLNCEIYRSKFSLSNDLAFFELNNTFLSNSSLPFPKEADINIDNQIISLLYEGGEHC